MGERRGETAPADAERAAVAAVRVGGAGAKLLLWVWLSVLAAGLAAGCRERQAGAAGGEATASSRSSENETEIRFGEVSSLTGQEATFGTSSRNGFALAVREINEAGGVLGRKIRIVTYDDQGKPTEAAAAATRLIVQDRVHLLLGEVASARSLAMAPIAQANRVPMITHASTNPRVTEGKDYVFRTCFIDPFQGKVMAKFAREHLGLAQVAVLRDVRNDYSVGLADHFGAAFTELGGRILADQSYSSQDIDFKAQLTALRSTRPQAIFVPGYYTDVGLIARQARELGIDVPLLGGDGWDSSRLFEIGGEAIEGSYFSNHHSLDDPDPRVQRFVAAYRAAYGERPDAIAALAYDAAMLAADAIRRAGSLDGAAIRDALAGTKEFPGVTGAITIDPDRNARKPAVVLQVKGGKAVYTATVAP